MIVLKTVPIFVAFIESNKKRQPLIKRSYDTVITHTQEHKKGPLSTCLFVLIALSVYEAVITSQVSPK